MWCSSHRPSLSSFILHFLTFSFIDQKVHLHIHLSKVATTSSSRTSFFLSIRPHLLKLSVSLPCPPPSLSSCCSFFLFFFNDVCFTFLSTLILPTVFVVGGSFSEKAKQNGGGDGASAGGCSDDYAYPPPPVSAVYSLSLPNSPVLYKKGATGGHSRNIPTPGRTPSFTGMCPLRAHTAPSSPHCSTRQQGVSTLPNPGREHWCQTGSLNKRLEEPLNRSLKIQFSAATCHNGSQNHPTQTVHQHHQPPELTKQLSVEELRSTVQTVASSIEHGTEDVRHLGQKMVAATEMITDSVEENVQALNLLAEVVDKLQGLIVASKHPESSTPHRSKQHTPPPPPQRVSPGSSKVCKPPTPYPRHLSSSSSSCSSSSSSTSVSSCADGFAMSQSPKPMNEGFKRTAVNFGAIHRVGECGSNRQVRLNNGSVSRAPLEDQQDFNSTGCLTTKKKKKYKEKKKYK